MRKTEGERKRERKESAYMRRGIYSDIVTPLRNTWASVNQIIHQCENGREKREEGRGKREEGRGKREEGRGKREEGRQGCSKGNFTWEIPVLYERRRIRQSGKRRRQGRRNQHTILRGAYGCGLWGRYDQIQTK
jgi:hypothetical protein